MIVTQDITRIAQALLKDTTGSLVEATWQSLTPLNLTPGQMVHGEVMANLANSRYLVRIANELLRMEIPLNLQPGQAVELTYVTDEPRLLFALSKSGNSAAPVQISDTGRWLNTLAQGAGDAPAASPLPRPSLVISGPPRDPALLAEGLKNVLTRSGIFYESHVAQWVRGERPLAELLREPQGQLSPLAGRLPAGGNGATPAPQSAGTAPASPGISPPLTSPVPSPAPASPAPAPLPSAMAVDAPHPEGLSAPVPPRPLAPPSGPLPQGTTPPTASGGAPAGAPPAGSVTINAPPKGSDAPVAVPREPFSPAGTQPAPQNQPASPLGGGEAPAPPAQPQQGGTASSPPSPPAAGASSASPQPSAATAGAPPQNSAGGISVPQPAATFPQGGRVPDAVLPQPTGGEHPAPASAPEPRPAVDSPPQTLLRNGAPTAPNGRAATPSPLPPLLDRGTRPPIPGEIPPADRGAAAPPPAGVEPQTIPLIKEQLATLTTGVFTWFGQAWPGQDMEWKVEEREAEGGNRGERSWLTEVAVELPTLGAVRAVLRSGKEGITVTLMAEDGRTAEILAAGQNGLEERFGAAGLKLGGFMVRDGTQ